MNQSAKSLRSIRWLLALFIAGLVFSGVTAIPLVTEVDFLTRLTGANELLERSASTDAPAWARWLTGIPLGWRLIDCSFGVLGAVPLYFCKQLIHDLTTNSFPASTSGDPAPIR